MRDAVAKGARVTAVLVLSAAAAIDCAGAEARAPAELSPAPAVAVAPPPDAATFALAPADVSKDGGVAAPAEAGAGRPGAYANLDPEDDFVVGPPDPVPDCEERLAHAGVRFARATLPVHTEGRAKLTCGAPQVVTYLGGPEKIAYDPPPLLTCTMALALASFGKIVQEEAARSLRTRVVRIQQLGTYACRVVPRYPTTMSEHGYANAIDIGLISLANGRAISIYRDFDRGDGDPKTASGAFLRAISRRANDEDVFSHVLTPFFDSAHVNHFHLDLARFRHDGTRPGLEP